jgi:hypothetical protein
MTSPERPPIEGLIEIGVRWEEGRERGLAVEVRGGGWGFEFEGENGKLEEVCRRGGVWGLAGRIWAGSASA